MYAPQYCVFTRTKTYFCPQTFYSYNNMNLKTNRNIWLTHLLWICMSGYVHCHVFTQCLPCSCGETKLTAITSEPELYCLCKKPLFYLCVDMLIYSHRRQVGLYFWNLSFNQQLKKESLCIIIDQRAFFFVLPNLQPLSDHTVPVPDH